MCKDLRKVFFSLGSYEFHPDATEAEQKEMADRSNERNGYFHKWVENVDSSKDIPYIKPLALVEDAKSGKIHEVETFNIRFTSDWQ